MDNLPDFATALKMAHKSNAPISFIDDSGNVLTIPADKVPEFQRKLAEKRDPGGKQSRAARIGCALFIVAVGVLLLYAAYLEAGGG